MKKLIVAASMLLGLCSQVHAVFIEKDWKNVNDGLITYDSESGLEWLDLTYTKRLGKKSYPKNSIRYAYRRTLEKDDPNYMPEFGNDLVGWRIANKEEVTTLLSRVLPSAPAPFYKHPIKTLESDGSRSYYAETDEYLNVKDFSALFGGKTFPDGSFQGVYGKYCEEDLTVESLSARVQPACYAVGTMDSKSFLGTDREIDDIWKANINNSSHGIFFVRGESTGTGYEHCPNQTDDMLDDISRQQAIEYIRYLSEQLTDPDIDVISRLVF